MKTTAAANILSAITVGVLAGAYRNDDDSRAMLTHLSDGGENPIFKSCVKPGNLGDIYSVSEEELHERPTCPRCAKAWDRARAA